VSQARRLAELAERSDMAGCLAGAGMDPQAARQKAEMLAGCARAMLRTVAQSAPAWAFFVPGRIEVLGKHTDYAGGRSIVAAAQRGFCMVAVGRDDAQVRIVDVAASEVSEFAISPELAPTAGHWSNYPMTVARRCARNFPPSLRGADVAFASDLPPAAGMSSSSAMMVAFFLALAGTNNLRQRQQYSRNIHSREELAGYLGAVENGQSFGSLAGDEGVGTFGGSEDHTAMLCCRAGALSQYSYRPVRFERTIELPEGYVFAIASSGVAAEKTGSALEKYNRASRLASTVAETWRRRTGRDDPHIAAAITAAGGDAEKIRDALRQAHAGQFATAQLLDRFEHFFAENEQIIPAAGNALASADIPAFGRLVDRSQQGAEELLGNQVPETIFLARSARALGASAASTFGAGFGGSVWALVDADRAGQFPDEWARRYAEAFPAAAADASFFLTGAGPAAIELL